MLKRWMSAAVVAMLCGWGVSAARAETRYVSDVLVVNLRDAPNDSAGTISHLRTGDALEVLAAQDVYLKVKTSKGEVGWVPQHYTDTNLPKGMVIENLETELARFKKRALEAEDIQNQLQVRLDRVENETNSELSERQRLLEAARREAADYKTKYQQVKQQYDNLVAKSDRVLEISTQRDRLQEENSRMQGEVGRLSDELGALTRSTAARWFLAGAGVFFIGWVVGSTARKKKGGKYSMG